MKKIILMFSFIFMLMGCSSMNPYKDCTLKQVDINGIKVTEITDNLSLEKNLLGGSFITGSTLNFETIVIDTMYNLKDKDAVMLFDDFGKRTSSKMSMKTDDLYLRNVLFTNKKEAINLRITDISSIDKNMKTIYQLKKSEIKKLIRILDSNYPVFIRVTTNSRTFTLTFKDKTSMLNVLKSANYLMNK